MTKKCPCGCHKSKSSDKEETEWEARERCGEKPFDRWERFDNFTEIKSFISDLLARQREEMLKEIKKIKERFRCAACDGAECEHTQCCQALKELLTKR